MNVCPDFMYCSLVRFVLIFVHHGYRFRQFEIIAAIQGDTLWALKYTETFFVDDIGLLNTERAYKSEGNRALLA